jgi:hypothetical protein
MVAPHLTAIVPGAPVSLLLSMVVALSDSASYLVKSIIYE